MKPKILLYTLYVAAAVAVSLYLRFPGEPLRDYVTHRAEQMLPGLSLAVAEVRPALPAAIRFQGIEAGYQDMPVLRFDQVRMAPEWGSILRLKPAAVFKTTIGGGSLRGVVHRSENMSLESLVSSIEFKEIQLAELRILDELFDRRITGQFSGKISRLSESSAKGLEIQVQLTNAAIELKLPVLQRDSLSVKQLQAEAAIVDGTRLQIKRCEFRGPEFDGELVGNIELKGDFANSVIDLQASATPHTVFMAELKKIVPPQLLSGKGRGGTFSLQLSGTLDKPRYSFR